MCGGDDTIKSESHTAVRRLRHRLSSINTPFSFDSIDSHSPTDGSLTPRVTNSALFSKRHSIKKSGIFVS